MRLRRRVYTRRTAVVGSKHEGRVHAPEQNGRGTPALPPSRLARTRRSLAMLDPWPRSAATSDNDAYVAFRFGGSPECEEETNEDDLHRLDVIGREGQGGGQSASAAARDRGAPSSSAAQAESEVRSPGPNGTSTRERVHDEPVRAILPVEIIDDRDRAELAAAARRDGGLVPAEPGDDGATLALKGRLARMHLRADDEGMHERALRALDEIASGDVQATHVTKKGEKVVVPLHPRFVASAAKAILAAAQAAAKTTGAKVEIANAQIVAAGDLIANVDPAKLRAAVARLRRGSV